MIRTSTFETVEDGILSGGCLGRINKKSDMDKIICKVLGGRLILGLIEHGWEMLLYLSKNSLSRFTSNGHSHDYRL